mgnify:CR=1 FL=1
MSDEFNEILDGDEMKLVREHLDETVDEVLLTNGVLACLDQVRQSREHLIQIDFLAHPLQLRQPRQVLPYRDL